MPDESRVKPQPLQPEAEETVEEAASRTYALRTDKGDVDLDDAAFYFEAGAAWLATIEEARRAAPHVGEFCNTCRGRIQIRCAKGCTQYNEAILVSLAAAPKDGGE